MKKIHELEVKAFSQLSNKQRYNYFVTKVFEWKSAWGLVDQEGWVVIEMGEDVIFPLWPAEPFAEKCQINDWQQTQVKEIKFDELVNAVLPDLAEDNIKVATFIVPGSDQCGVLPAQELLNDFLTLQAQEKSNEANAASSE